MGDSLSDSVLDSLFRHARSYNSYMPRPVSVEQIHAIWDLMKYGPTSANQLPSRLVWCTTPEAKAKLAECVHEKNAAKIRTAPVSVVIGMDSDFHDHLPELFPHADAHSWFADDVELRKRSAFRNSSLQGGYFIIAARALGLDVGPLSGFDHAKVDAAFFADAPSVGSNFISTMGYGDPSSIFPRLPRPSFDKFNRVL